MDVKNKIFEKEKSQWTTGLETLIDKISTTEDYGLQTLIETLEKKWCQEEKTNTSKISPNIARIVKLA